MDQFASLSMLAAAACWLRPTPARAQAGEALEWRLLSALLAASALLVWQSLHGSATAFAVWAAHAGACGVGLALLHRMQTRRPVWAVTSISILAAGLYGRPAGAEELAHTIAVEPLRTAQAPAEPASLETIVVTGTRTAHRLGDAPVDVQLITAADIRNSGARDLAELLAREGGVYATRVAGRGSEIEIQGLSSEHVLVLVDGRRMIGRIDGAIDLTRLRLDSIERVEIVKGPSSALYGADALGGVVNVITRRDGSGGSALTLRGDGDGNAEVFGNAGWQLGKRLGGRLSGGRFRLESYDLDERTVGRDGVDGDNRFASGTLRWQGADESLVDADLAYALDDSLRVDAGSGGAVYDTRKRIEELRTGIAPQLALGAATLLRVDAYYHRYFDQFLQQAR
ncbi:MAG: TonB-dependent receptor plug domain-containing protein, partial [Gammaproteobacteria bacterium]